MNPSEITKLLKEEIIVTFKILGFSLATINVLISGLILIISSILIKNEKNR